ncbi:MAG TPA: DUF420 domain-containing protein [Lacipirellulaceae bacterium]|nr:DUF420 domain-containing protein [Lacipirellulaceae bacterium]
MLDVVCLSMIGVVIVLAWSIYQVKMCRRYQLHQWTQITLGILLLVVVVLFELDIRLHGWEARAAGHIGVHPPSIVFTALYVHLIFAVSTVILWPATIGFAVANFGVPPRPGSHSRIHIPLAWTATADMFLTAVTGWVFYWLAFVR